MSLTDRPGHAGRTRQQLIDLSLPVATESSEAGSLDSEWQTHTSKGIGWETECRLPGRHGADLDVVLVIIPVSAGEDERERLWLVVAQDLTETIIHTHELEIYARELSQLYQSNLEYTGQLVQA